MWYHCWHLLLEMWRSEEGDLCGKFLGILSEGFTIPCGALARPYRALAEEFHLEIFRGNLIESKPPFLLTRLVTITALFRRYSPSPHPLFSHVPALPSSNRS